jgi:hypothetical protein
VSLYEALLYFFVPMIVSAAAVYAMSALLMRPETYCLDCGERIRGWVWEGEYGLVRRQRAHWESSCPSTWRREG